MNRFTTKWKHLIRQTGRLAILISLIICLAVQPSAALQDETLSQPLQELAAANNPEEYAANHGITYRNGSVEVVIELSEEMNLTESYGVNIESQFEHQGTILVQGFVPVDQLSLVANDSAVDKVRLPNTGVADNPPSTSTSSSASAPEQPDTQTTSTTEGSASLPLPVLGVALLCGGIIALTRS
jgi:hypothetical protein